MSVIQDYFNLIRDYELPQFLDSLEGIVKSDDLYPFLFDHPTYKRFLWFAILARYALQFGGRSSEMTSRLRSGVPQSKHRYDFEDIVDREEQDIHGLDTSIRSHRYSRVEHDVSDEGDEQSSMSPHVQFNEFSAVSSAMSSPEKSVPPALSSSQGSAVSPPEKSPWSFLWRPSSSPPEPLSTPPPDPKFEELTDEEGSADEILHNRTSDAQVKHGVERAAFNGSDSALARVPDSAEMHGSGSALARVPDSAEMHGSGRALARVPDSAEMHGNGSALARGQDRDSIAINNGIDSATKDSYAEGYILLERMHALYRHAGVLTESKWGEIKHIIDNFVSCFDRNGHVKPSQILDKRIYLEKLKDMIINKNGFPRVQIVFNPFFIENRTYLKIIHNNIPFYQQYADFWRFQYMTTMKPTFRHVFIDDILDIDKWSQPLQKMVEYDKHESRYDDTLKAWVDNNMYSIRTIILDIHSKPKLTFKIRYSLSYELYEFQLNFFLQYKNILDELKIELFGKTFESKFFESVVKESLNTQGLFPDD